MNKPLTRRRALAIAAATTAAGTLPFLQGTSRSVMAIEPVARSGQAKFKFSLAAYSYRDLFQPKRNSADKPLTLFDFADDCATMQLEGTELTSYYFPSPVTSEFLTRLRSHCFRLGLDVSGTAIGNDFCHPPGTARDQQIAQAKQWIDHAAMLGAPVIRIFSGSVKRNQDEAHRLAVAAMEECCDYAGGKGIHLALENHGGLTETAAGMLKLVDDVKSPWFGVNFDSGNFHGKDVYAELAQIAPYAINAQIKVVVSPAGQRKQPSDFKRLAKILREANYRGYVVLEYEENENPQIACPKYMEQLREAFA